MKLEEAAEAIFDGSATLDQIEAWLDSPYRAHAAEIMEVLVRGLVKRVRARGKRLAEAELCVDAVNEIRTLLLREDVPTAAFVDDHVRNAVVQRNRAMEALTAIAGGDGDPIVIARQTLEKIDD